MKNLALAFLMIFLGTIVNFAQQNKAETKTAADIRNVLETQTKAWNAGDIDGFMQGYWNSPQLVFVGSNVTRGWQPTLDNYKKKYDSRAKMGVLTFSDLEIEVLSKNAAVVLGSWSLVREKDNPHGKFTLIFRKFKDGWKIIHDHTS